jgi:16S rRNA (cytosine1402-N4)-methyltransferase
MSLFIAKTFGNNVARISSLRKYSSFPWQQVHIPVLLDQVIEHLNPKEGGTYCDLTFGEGGYTKALLGVCVCYLFI